MAITLDAAAPLISVPRDLRRYASELREGGVDAVLATVGSIEDFTEMAGRLGAWAAFAHAPDDRTALARTVAEIEAAHDDGKLAVVLHMQGASATGMSTDALHLFHALGVRVMQLTYNYRNQLGDGCLEPANSGLSELGRRCVRQLNELGIVLDVSHSGVQTSLDIIELADGPVVATHANAMAVCSSPRNLSDALIRALAQTGGVVGLCAFSAFVAPGDATLDRLLDHAAYISDLVGPGHLGIGLDFAKHTVDDFDYYGLDERYYPRPPWRWPDGITGFADTKNVPVALARRGFSSDEIDGIMGANFLRVFRQRWGA